MSSCGREQRPHGCVQGRAQHIDAERRVEAEAGLNADHQRVQDIGERVLQLLLVLDPHVVQQQVRQEEAADPSALAGELADVMLYLLQLASISQIDLGQAVLDKLDVNYGRDWEA